MGSSYRKTGTAATGPIVAAGSVLAAGVMVSTIIVACRYIVRPRQVQNLGDWAGVLLPVVPPAIALLSARLLWRNEKRGPVGKGAVRGLFAGCAGYMTLQAWTLATEFTLISLDGTAHWALLQLPAALIAVPLFLAAAGIGAGAGYWQRRVKDE